jgi:hypothetical protein
MAYGLKVSMYMRICRGLVALEPLFPRISGPYVLRAPGVCLAEARAGIILGNSIAPTPARDKGKAPVARSGETVARPARRQRSVRTEITYTPPPASPVFSREPR